SSLDQSLQLIPNAGRNSPGLREFARAGFVRCTPRAQAQRASESVYRPFPRDHAPILPDDDLVLPARAFVFRSALANPDARENWLRPRSIRAFVHSIEIFLP